MRRIPICLSVLAIALLTSFGSTSVAAAKSSTVVLKDPTSGLTVRAPRGYKLTAASGAYTLTGGGVRTRFFFGPSALDAKATGAQLARALGGKVKVAIATPKRYAVTVTKGNVATVVRITKVGGNLQFVLMNKVRTSKTAVGVRDARLGVAQVSATDIVRLERLVNTRRGGAAARINTTIPRTGFTAADKGSSATVLDLPGWSWSGNAGSIEGGHPTQGFVALGEVGGVTNGISSQFAVSPSFVGPAEVIQSIYPQYVRIISGSTVQVTNVQLIAGTEGILGAQTPNGMYQVALTINGGKYVGIFLVSSSDAAGLAPSAWYFYYSAAVISVNAPASVGDALLDVWASWDASGASKARLAQALATLASTPSPGAPIDPVVFQEAANKWGAYIRG